VNAGRGFTDADQQLEAKVCLIGKTATDKLFGSTDPIGRYVRIGKYPYRIVGTLTPKGQSPFEDQDDRVLMPIGGFRARVLPTLGDRVQLVMAPRTASNEPTARSIEAIGASARHRRGDD
jgi:putative ABC transport system permease protein